MCLIVTISYETLKWVGYLRQAWKVIKPCECHMVSLFLSFLGLVGSAHKDSGMSLCESCCLAYSRNC